MSGAPRVGALVVGGGVVGCAVLRELARHDVEAVLVEREPDLCEGTSKANSAIVHTGFDARPGSIEAAMLRRAAALWPELVEGLALPYLAVGALMLARSAAEMARLRDGFAPRATAFGVRTELLGREELRATAPWVTEAAVGAMSIPDEAVTDPFWLTRALAASALASGARLHLGAAATGLEVDAGGVTVRLDDGAAYRADQVFLCAGLWSDEVARLAGDASFWQTPRKGQFLVSEETFGIDRIVLPLPGPMGKGMLLTPIVFGGLLLGPTAEDGQDKEDRSTDRAGRERILAACSAMVPAIAETAPIRSFAGLRAVSSAGDYILRPSTAGERLFIVAGIRSTGLSAAPAIAEHVVARVAGARGWHRSARYVVAPPVPLFSEEPGPIACLCRSVSRGEVAAALASPETPPTLDALKRRCGAGFGDCQGNLCAVEVAVQVADARGLPIERVLKHRAGSWVFTGQLAGAAADAGRPRRGPRETGAPPAPPGGRWDLVVVGAGLAGIGTALGFLDGAAGERAGPASLLVIERERPGGTFRGCPTVLHPAEREAVERFGRAVVAGSTAGGPAAFARGTAVGLLRRDDGPAVLVQDDAGSWEAPAHRVVLATGGYVAPCEHRPIDGPRPSGVLTADLVHGALDRGLHPGRSAVLAGAGRYADATAARLEAAGTRIVARVPSGDAVTALRGEGRLEAVRLGGQWLVADTLVLADRLLPSAFLVRAAGLVDARPGIAVPVDAEGATPLPGVHAAGTCTEPEIDHRASLAAGLALGRRLARAFAMTPTAT